MQAPVRPKMTPIQAPNQPGRGQAHMDDSRIDFEVSLRRDWWAYAALLSFALLLGGIWAVSSPVGSSPDDDFHLASIWCARDDPALCQRSNDPSSGQPTASVPAQVVGEICFAYHPETSAACIAALGTELTNVGTRVNSGGYPPGFYEFLGPLVGGRPYVSVVMMRMAVLVSILFCWSIALWASPALRKSQILAWTVSSIPLGLFLFASTNPSSWASAGLAALLPSVMALFGATTAKQAIPAVASLVVAMALILDSRADVAAMSAVFLLWAAVVLTRARRQIPQALVCVGLAVVSGLVYRAVTMGAALTEGITGAQGNFSLALMWSNALQIPSLWAGVTGVNWGLGWLDTGIPAVVWVPTLLIIGGLLYTALERFSRTKALLALPVVAMLFFLPWYTLQQSAAVVGGYFQPRYILPLVMLFMGIVLAPIGASRLRISDTQASIGAILCSLAASVALHTQIRRYVTGSDFSHPNLNLAVEWWQFPISPMTTWLIGTLAGCGLFTLAFWLNRELPVPATPLVQLTKQMQRGWPTVLESPSRTLPNIPPRLPPPNLESRHCQSVLETASARARSIPESETDPPDGGLG